MKKKLAILALGILIPTAALALQAGDKGWFVVFAPGVSCASLNNQSYHMALHGCNAEVYLNNCKPAGGETCGCDGEVLWAGSGCGNVDPNDGVWHYQD